MTRTDDRNPRWVCALGAGVPAVAGLILGLIAWAAQASPVPPGPSPDDVPALAAVRSDLP